MPRLSTVILSMEEHLDLVLARPGLFRKVPGKNVWKWCVLVVTGMGGGGALWSLFPKKVIKRKM